MTKERAALERILAFVTDPQRMTHWDSWRSYIARGGTASGPRDGFESLLNWIEEEAREALATQVEPKAEPLPAGYIECDNCKSRFLADRGGESCVACGHTLNRPAEPEVPHLADIPGHPEVRLTEMTFKAKEDEPFEATAQYQGDAVKEWALAMVQWFREKGGINYVACDLRDPTTGESYAITMQKAGGRTPAQDLAEMRAQLNREVKP